MAYGRRAIWFCGESVKAWVTRNPFWLAIATGILLLVAGLSIFLTVGLKEDRSQQIPALVWQTAVPTFEPSLRPTLVPTQQLTNSPVSRPSPALKPSPGHHPCAICGEGLEVGSPRGMMVLPDFASEEIPCMLGEFAGISGYVPPEQCKFVTAFYTANCGCRIASSLTTTETPSEASPIPTSPIFLDPTPSPASGSTEFSTPLPTPPQTPFPTPPQTADQTRLPTSAPIPPPTPSPTPPTSSPTPRPTTPPTPPPSFVSDPLNPPSTPVVINPSPAPTPRPTTPMPVVLAQTPPPTTAEPTIFQIPAANGPTLTEFCVIADVPYTAEEEEELKEQIATLPPECEFIVHLGDIQKGDISCTEDRYDKVNSILNKSAIPMFMVLGDNEWNDCPAGQKDMGWDNWNKYFLRYDNEYWNHNYQVVSMDEHAENFYFVHRRTLFMVLNLVGGAIYPSKEAWEYRLSVTVNWVQTVMNAKLPSEASGVVIMAHCQIQESQSTFFGPLRDFIQFVLKNKYPILYLHGDGHAWIHTTNFFNQQSYVRIQTSGGTTDPVLLMRVDPHNHLNNADAAFGYDRRLN